MVLVEESTIQAPIRRLVAGSRCDARGCRREALWVVTFDGHDYHWCALHTRREMKDSEKWRAELPRSERPARRGSQTLL